MKMYKQKNNLEVIQMLIAIDHGNFAILCKGIFNPEDF